MSSPVSPVKMARVPRILTVKEYDPIEIAPTDVLVSGQLQIKSEVINRYVRVDFSKDGLRVTAQGVCGLIPLTDNISIQVLPRVPLTNLTHMVSVCGYPPAQLAALRKYDSGSDVSDWLWEVYAEGLLTTVELIEQLGLLRRYTRQKDASSAPRGRVEATTTMLRRASRNVHHVADFSWFERTIDTPENRCLKEAVVRVHRHYLGLRERTGSRRLIARLANALRLFAEVSPDPHGESLRDPVVSGLRTLPDNRSYYREGLNIAINIMFERGLNLDTNTNSGSVALPSLLVKTDDLFEDFVRLGLQQAFASDADIYVLDGNLREGQLPLYQSLTELELSNLESSTRLLSESSAVTKPDFLLRHRDGRTLLVGDVKYTKVVGHADRSEVEQVILYGARYASPVVLTVHPRTYGARGGLFISGKMGDFLVAQYRLDLAAEDLDMEIEQMADSVRHLSSHWST